MKHSAELSKERRDRGMKSKGRKVKDMGARHSRSSDKAESAITASQQYLGIVLVAIRCINR